MITNIPHIDTAHLNSANAAIMSRDSFADIAAFTDTISGNLSLDLLDATLSPRFKRVVRSHRTGFRANSSQTNAQSTATPLEHGLTEIAVNGTITKGIDLGSELILDSLINRLGRIDDNRWITVICQHKRNQSYWQHLDMDTSSIRMIYLAKPEDFLWVTWEALAKGNSRAVIAHTNPVAPNEKQHLIDAAITGETHGFLLTH